MICTDAQLSLDNKMEKYTFYIVINTLYVMEMKEKIL